MIAGTSGLLRGMSIGLLVAAISALAMLQAVAQNRGAQNAPARGAQPAAPQPPQEAAPTQQPHQPPPPVPFRTEILNFDSWNVTCREFVEPKKRECAAVLQITQTNTNQVILVWSFGMDAGNRPVAVLQVPTGVMIGPGVELRLEKAQPRKIAYTACDNSRCTASVSADAALVRDMTAAATAEVTIQATNGNNLRFNVPIKGFDKAYAALTSK